MNAVNEQNLDLLEEYLDEALAPDEVDALRIRLAEDAGLAAALQELRRDRDVRSAVWAANEPSEQRARQFAARVSTTARRNDLRSRVFRTSRFAGAAAACLMLGVFVGWLGRDRSGGDPSMAQLATTGPRVAAPVRNVADNFVFSGPASPAPGVSITEIRYNTPRGPLPMLLVTRATNAPQGAGLREGDLLLSVDGKVVRDVRSLGAELSSRPGTHVIRIVRENQVHDLPVQLQSR